MAYDSMVSIPAATANAKDFAKKKRANRSAKLKQNKLDARREQWLSQVKNKGSKEELNGSGAIDERKGRDQSMENLEINPGREENKGAMNHFSDFYSPSNSPTSHTSSVLGSNESGTNFTGSSSSSSSGGCCSGSITEDDDEADDGGLDDWEAIADALAATSDKQDQDKPNLESSPERESGTQPKLTNQQNLGAGVAKLNQDHVGTGMRVSANAQAWRPDDAFRPQSLPNLLKQHSFPTNSDRHYSRGTTAWGSKTTASGCKNVTPAPASCPICCEDLDLTDSSFLPCSCGFRLCLFCHKRILEQDGRCPGCRKQFDYDAVEGEAILDGGSLTFRLVRSCSMITRS